MKGNSSWGAALILLGRNDHARCCCRIERGGPCLIDTCIADRRIEQLDPVKLRKYCTCMQQIVEDNEPFSVSELEHSYPPAHVMCQGEAGL